MVAIGFGIFALGLLSLVARVRGKLFEWTWLHRLAILFGPAGFVAVIAGWITTEVGRQPFTIYGLLRTADSASPLAAPAIGASLIAFIAIYFFVFGAGTWYILKLMAKPPKGHESADPVEHGPIRSAGITPAPAIEGGER
jgi:cytochrome d ubiquinol oxidase subunit I